MPVSAVLVFWLCCIVFMALIALGIAVVFSSKAKAEVASYYGAGHHGRRTASGERFNMHAFTAAHRTHRFGTWLRVCRPSGAGVNARCTRVRISDRGPFIRGRDLDLSYGAAKAIGLVAVGVGRVLVERIK